MKLYFIGLMLASCANSESGIAIIDSNNQIILLDKLFTMNDVQFFFDNFSSLKQSKICISIPQDSSMLNGKWRVLSKLYQLIDTKGDFKNIDNWTQRLSSRGCEYFSSLADNNIDISRFDMYLTRQSLNLNSYYKQRSPADCKALQSALRLQKGFSCLPTNMMPMAQLEAIVGAILAKQCYEKEQLQNSDNIILNKKSLNFNGIPVFCG